MMIASDDGLISFTVKVDGMVKYFTAAVRPNHELRIQALARCTVQCAPITLQYFVT